MSRLATLPIVLLGAACAGGAAPAAAPQPEAPATIMLGPSSTRYLLVSRGAQEQDFGGQVQSTSSTIRAHLTSALAPGTDGLALTVTIDSILEASGQGIFSSQGAQAAGQQITATITPTGRIVGEVTSAAQSTLMQQIANGVRFFYPRMPDAGITAGAVWVDSVETSVPTGQVDLQLAAISSFAAGEWVEMDGAMTLPVTLSQITAVTGTGEQAGAQFTIDGTGVSHGMLYFAADGTYLGIVSSDTIRADVNVEAAGLVIPVTIFQADTVRALR